MTVKWPPATLPLAGTESVPALQGGKIVGVPATTFGGGAVTSVGLIMPGNFVVANSPVTTAGNLTVSYAPQNANLVLAGPTSGVGPPTFRALVAADLPGGGGGTVSSVGLAMPSIFTVTNSPVTASGVLTAALNNQTQGLVLASPAAATGQPSFRALTATDIPSLSGTYLPLAGGALTGDLTVGGNLSINGVGGINAVGPLGVGGTITGADIAISASKPARQVWAAPVGSPGVPSFRLLAATDIPSLSYLPLAGGNLSGSLTINSTLNTTGLATLGDLAVSAAKTASFALIAPGAGGAPAWRQIAATDISGLSGGGSVSSVGLTMPGDFTVANSPVTTAGTLTVTRNSQAAHQVLAAPAGGAGVPTYRILQTTDIPNLSGTYLPLVGGNLSGPGDLGVGGNLTVTGFGVQVTSTASTIFALNKNASGSSNNIYGRTTPTSNRWQMVLGDSTAEGGSNTGSNFQLNNFSDTSVQLGTPLAINRATGLVTLQDLGVSATKTASQALIAPAAGGAPVWRQPATTDLSDVTGVITFTPTITAATSGDLTVAYLQQFGFYVKIGILYFVNIVLTFTPTYTTASGNLRFVGMPVGTSTQLCQGSGAFQRLPIAAGSQLTPYMSPSSGYGGVITSVNNAAQTALAITAIPSGTANVTIQFTGMYY